MKYTDAEKWIALMGAFPWHTDEPINGGDVVDFIANILMEDVDEVIAALTQTD
jgi:hypothetical protein